MRRCLIVPVLAMLLVACEDATAPEPELSAHRQAGHRQPIVVMSRNLYLGADIYVLLDPSANLPEAIAAALTQILITDFRARAKELAKEIHAVQPHLIGLQEVTTYVPLDATFQPVGMPEYGFPLDYLSVLLNELAQLGDVYVPARYTQNLFLPLPFAFGSVAYIAYSDADAILARGDVVVHASAGGNYLTQQTLNVGGFEFENMRGYGFVDASIDDVDVRFASTHLEIQQFRDVQEAQARELVDVLADSPLPVILLGDFNSAANRDAPDGSKTRSYNILRYAGYADLWLVDGHRGRGVTCCQAADLSNTTSTLDQRLDIVFARWGRRGFDGDARVDLVGERERDIFTHPSTDLIPVEYTLWPSDHAGIAARVRPAWRRVASWDGWEPEHDGYDRH